MNCEKVQERIDEMIFNSGVHPDQNIQSHLNTCEECSSYYQEAIKDRQLMKVLEDSQPVLLNPEGLTDSIMQSITNEPSEQDKDTSNIKLLIRLLAAAVIALLLTLGIEQYIVLNKILILETELAKVQLPNSIDRTRIYKASLMDIDLMTKNLDQGISISKIRALMRFKQAKQFNFTFYDINRYMIKDELLTIDLPSQIENGND